MRGERADRKSARTYHPVGQVQVQVQMTDAIN